ncbi:MAG: type 4a pilus biogenesis protein PilO [Candidatus Omnitrophica bacterium]|nr:type 4a pilus biogenesis protein PilO [Candidatus Omnitrophota bacterium]
MIKLTDIDIKNPKHQAIILAALIAILTVILYFILLLQPQVMRIIGTVIKDHKMKADLKSMESEIANIGRYSKEIGAYKDKVERYERMLPAEQEIPTLLESLSGMAKSSGVKIVGITPVVIREEKKREGQIYQEIPILISAKSGYHELGNFLAKLEDSDRFMKVADIEIRANKAMPKRHDTEVLVFTYILLKGR